jgi:hypothetical protein
VVVVQASDRTTLTWDLLQNPVYLIRAQLPMLRDGAQVMYIFLEDRGLRSR